MLIDIKNIRRILFIVIGLVITYSCQHRKVVSGHHTYVSHHTKRRHKIPKNTHPPSPDDFITNSREQDKLYYDQEVADEKFKEIIKEEELLDVSEEEDLLTGSSGLLTAGRWSDLDHWDFWREVSSRPKWQHMDSTWQLFTQSHVSVQLKSGNKPVVDKEIFLETEDGSILWTARSNNFGQAHLYYNAFGEQDTSPLYIHVKSANQSIKKAINLNAILPIVIEVKPNKTSAKADIMFVVDASGSMKDELKFLKSELKNIVTDVQSTNKKVTFRFSANFYRDYGDAYVTRSFPFWSNAANMVTALQMQSAEGGADFEEAVEEALTDAIDHHNWSESAQTRLLFLILDASPRKDPSTIKRIQKSIKAASNKGIRIIPVASSGIKKETEFLLRQMSILTGGEYTFITNDSGFGDAHTQPTIGNYEVKFLHEIIIEVINDYVKKVNTI